MNVEIMATAIDPEANPLWRWLADVARNILESEDDNDHGILRHEGFGIVTEYVRGIDDEGDRYVDVGFILPDNVYPITEAGEWAMVGFRIYKEDA